MSARIWVAIFIFYTIGALYGGWCSINQGSEIYMVLSVVNVAMGVCNLIDAIDCGLRYGWRS